MTLHKIPACFGYDVPWDDCYVSCAYTDYCKLEYEENEEEAERARRMKPIWDRCDECKHYQGNVEGSGACTGCHAEDIDEVCSTCPALQKKEDSEGA